MWYAARKRLISNFTCPRMPFKKWKKSIIRIELYVLSKYWVNIKPPTKNVQLKTVINEDFCLIIDRLFGFSFVFSVFRLFKLVLFLFCSKNRSTRDHSTSWATPETRNYISNECNYSSISFCCAYNKPNKKNWGQRSKKKTNIFSIWGKNEAKKVILIMCTF